MPRSESKDDDEAKGDESKGGEAKGSGGRELGEVASGADMDGSSNEKRDAASHMFESVCFRWRRSRAHPSDTPAARADDGTAVRVGRGNDATPPP